MTIHSGHPFATPEGDRDQVRRLRGALGGAVTLWAAGSGDAAAVLTVTSLLVAPGDPARLVALLDPDSDLCERLGETGRAVVTVLDWAQRDLADIAAGVAPAPGGWRRFAEFEETDYGPRLRTLDTWCLVSLESERTVGWSREVTCVIEALNVGAGAPLIHRRGRYQRPAPE
jgi:flavin reductase (DIM6/NTAB) family NADH-FMN oxidoreductase RutF